MSIETYETRPQEVQAIQWTGDNTVELLKFCPWIVKRIRDSKEVLVILPGGRRGNNYVHLNHWIIRHRKNVYEAMNPRTFHSTYRKTKGKIE